jgi:carbon monoxide dehydrogenase subunit G
MLHTMKFENTFEVPAPVDAVWPVLMDVERVAPCMPGAQVLEKLSDDAYQVSIKVKVGPISMTYRGQVEIVEQDPAAHRARLHVRAKEARGQGSAEAHVVSTLAEAGGGTRAVLETEVQLTGKAASMGRGVIGDVAERLVQTFAGNLAEMVSAEGAPAAPEGAPAAAEGAPATPEPPPPPPPPKPQEAQALEVGGLAAGVIAHRLGQPRNLAVALGAVAALFGLLGFRAGRRRR